MQRKLTHIAKLMVVLFLFCSISYADISTGLINYWDFNENSVVDSVGGLSFNLRNGAFVSGNELVLDTSGEDADVVLSTFNPATHHQFSLSFTMSFSGAPDSRMAMLELRGASYILIHTTDDRNNNGQNHIFAEEGISGSQQRIHGDKSVHDGDDHMVVFTYDHNSVSDNVGISIYVDTELAGIASWNGNDMSDSWTSITLYLGKDNWKNNFTGTFDDVRFYNRVLSQADINELFAERFIITEHPKSQTVEAGSNVEFTISSGNIDSYQWYKSADSVTNPGSDTAIGGNSDTLIVSNVNLTDEAWYYCIATKGGESLTSQAARLMIRRLVGHWEFENDLNDTVTLDVNGVTAHNGFMILNGSLGGTADYNSSSPGNMGDYSLDLGDSEIVQIENSNEYFNFYRQGITVSAWVRTAQTGWGAIIGKQQRASSPYSGFMLNKNDSGIPIFTFRDPGTNQHDNILAQTAISDGQWHFITATYNNETKTGKIFVDGQLEGKLTSMTKNYDVPDEPLVFGRESVDTAGYYEGGVDDIRIWNYPLESIEIGTLYIETMPDETICYENPEYDLDGPDGESDCVVDIYDLAYFTQRWMVQEWIVISF